MHCLNARGNVLPFCIISLRYHAVAARLPLVARYDRNQYLHYAYIVSLKKLKYDNDYDNNYDKIVYTFK